MTSLIAAAVVAVTAAVSAACTTPSGPPPVLDPGPPVISSFGARTARSEAPVLATFGWQVSDPDRQPLTCRIDVGSDGSFEHELEGCRSVDSVLEQFTSAGTHSATLEVSDGDWPPVTATTSVTVTPGPAEPYDITLRLDPSMRPEFADAFTRAAQRWESVLVAGVRDVRLDLPAGLFGWVPAYAGTVDDVLIDARDTPIDGEGEVLGQAGGLLIRQPQWQPYYGVMEFDTADLDALWTSGRLDDVILHEMGHVLGLGTNWVFTGVVVDLLTDPAYTGAAGVAAYQSLGGDRFVPLEKGGGTGTAIGHWRETTFDDELMTGYLGRRPAKLSEVTIAALADLGYGVDLTVADPYVLPANRSALRGSEPAEDHAVEAHTEQLRPFLGGLPDPLPASP
jgi:hypothetical protein